MNSVSSFSPPFCWCHLNSSDFFCIHTFGTCGQTLIFTKNPNLNLFNEYSKPLTLHCVSVKLHPCLWVEMSLPSWYILNYRPVKGSPREKRWAVSLSTQRSRYSKSAKKALLNCFSSFLLFPNGRFFSKAFTISNYLSMCALVFACVLMYTCFYERGKKLRFNWIQFIAWHLQKCVYCDSDKVQCLLWMWTSSFSSIVY